MSDKSFVEKLTSLFSVTEIRNSITYKVLKIVFSIYFLITITVTFVHMFAEYKNAKYAVQEELKHFEKIFKPSLSSALWELENDLIESTADGILFSPIVVGVTIKPLGEYDWKVERGVFLQASEKDGVKTLVNAYKTKEMEENEYRYDYPEDEIITIYMNSTLIPHSFDIIYVTFEGIEHKLGEAVIYSSTAIVFDHVKLGFVFILVNAIIKTIALWVLFLWGGNKFVTKPLKKLTGELSNISLSNLHSVQVYESSDQEQTELHLLQDEFNFMINNLKDEMLQRRIAREKLARSEKYLVETFNCMPSILIGLDNQGKITNCNIVTEKFLNKSAAELSGKSLVREIEFLSDEIKQKIMRAIEKKESCDLEKQDIMHNGKKMSVNIVVYPLKGTDMGYMIRMDDISEQVKIESIIVQNEKMSSLGVLAAGMAHEINNPLGGILQGVQNIKRRLDPEMKKNKQVADEIGVDFYQMKQYLDSRGIMVFLQGIQDVGERAAKLVRSMLKFSRSNNEKMVSTNINGLIQEVIEMVITDYEISRYTKSGKLDIIANYSDELSNIICSPGELEQVFLNLIKNGFHSIVDKSVEEKGLITISLKKGESDKYVVVEIEDNGKGMSAKVKKRIFEPFYTTKPVGVGTGLGLSISYPIIVEKHKGKFEVESEEGKGAKFIMTLPKDPDNE